MAKLEQESANGTVKIFDTQGLDVESVSSFSSIRANVAVFSGKWYYEVRLLTSGLMQLGWCTFGTPFTHDRGVGDDPTSYAYDGFRLKKWNHEESSYGEGWAAGDIIGTLIDFDSKEITFYRNDKCLGVAFKRIKTGPNMAYFPAISLAGGQRVVFNFGALQPFK